MGCRSCEAESPFCAEAADHCPVQRRDYLAVTITTTATLLGGLIGAGADGAIGCVVGMFVAGCLGGIAGLTLEQTRAGARAPAIGSERRIPDAVDLRIAAALEMAATLARHWKTVTRAGRSGQFSRCSRAMSFSASGSPDSVQSRRLEMPQCFSTKRVKARSISTFRLM